MLKKLMAIVSATILAACVSASKGGTEYEASAQHHGSIAESANVKRSATPYKSPYPIVRPDCACGGASGNIRREVSDAEVFAAYPNSMSEYVRIEEAVCIDSFIDEQKHPHFTYEYPDGPFKGTRGFIELCDTDVIYNGYVAPGGCPKEISEKILSNLRKLGLL